MIVHKLILPMLATLALSACVQVPPTLLKETTPMTMSAGNYRPHKLDEYPDFTPEELGRRMLELIDSLTSFDELSLARVQDVMRLPLHEMPSGTSHAFGMHLPASDWYYVFDYDDNPRDPDYKGVTYRFNNKKEPADMGPVCAMNYGAYVAVLQRMGFQEREDLSRYDAIRPPSYRNEATGQFVKPQPQFRRLPIYFFTRANVVVQIMRRREADVPNEKLHHACVEKIDVRRFGKG